MSSGAASGKPGRHEKTLSPREWATIAKELVALSIQCEKSTSQASSRRSKKDRPLAVASI